MKLTNDHNDLTRDDLLPLADRALYFINANWSQIEKAQGGRVRSSCRAIEAIWATKANEVQQMTTRQLKQAITCAKTALRDLRQAACLPVELDCSMVPVGEDLCDVTGTADPRNPATPLCDAWDIGDDLRIARNVYRQMREDHLKAHPVAQSRREARLARKATKAAETAQKDAERLTVSRATVLDMLDAVDESQFPCESDNACTRRDCASEVLAAMADQIATLPIPASVAPVLAQFLATPNPDA